MNIFIGGAWPYANGSLHIGHIAALLPGDVLARYYRLKGYSVCYVSGSDCHGTPIQIRANKEGVSPEQISNYYHNEFKSCFDKLGFTFDLYNQTNDSFHSRFVQEFFAKLLDSGYIYKKTVEQAFCQKCNQFLPDRFVVGKCPNCGSIAKGDQCDSCGSLLEPSNLNDRRCGICGESPICKHQNTFFWLCPNLSNLLRNTLTVQVDGEQMLLVYRKDILMKDLGIGQ
jgi:methionyl-tRNA synthetase